MMNYISWANEYFENVAKCEKMLEEAKRQKHAARTPDEIKQANDRIIMLDTLFHEQQITAKKLRRRGLKK